MHDLGRPPDAINTQRSLCLFLDTLSKEQQRLLVPEITRAAQARRQAQQEAPKTTPPVLFLVAVGGYGAVGHIKRLAGVPEEGAPGLFVRLLRIQDAIYYQPKEEEEKGGALQVTAESLQQFLKDAEEQRLPLVRMRPAAQME